MISAPKKPKINNNPFAPVTVRKRVEKYFTVLRVIRANLSKKKKNRIAIRRELGFFFLSKMKRFRRNVDDEYTKRNIITYI